jgi:aryl-alcohol dehydrogenase-like predicted oxidoreductase
VKLPSFALGCMGFSGIYGPTTDDASVAVIRAAVERGVTLLDTGDFYGMGHNEWLVRRALGDDLRKRVMLSVKFGAQRGPDGAFLGFDSRPAAVKAACAYSLQRLGVEAIDIYRPARLDATVPIEDTIGAIADLVKAGYVRHIGLSEVGVETIKRAHAVHPIVDLQIEYALITRGPEDKIFPVLRELGIGATLYGVLSRGLLSGSAVGAKDPRARFPRFQEANRATNQKAVDAVRAFGADRGLSPSQVAIAYVAGKQPGFTPTIGTRTLQQLADALAAIARPLNAADIAALEALVPADAIAGTRYDAHSMKALDSEKS